MTWTIVLLLVVLIAVLQSKEVFQILNVGVLFARNDTQLAPFIGWRETAGAVGVAWDKIQRDGILPEYSELNLTWVISDCDNSLDAGSIIEWVRNGVDVVLGPACSSSAVVSGIVGKYFNFPMVIWAPTFSSVLLNSDDYPTVMATTWSSIRSTPTMESSEFSCEQPLIFCGMISLWMIGDPFDFFDLQSGSHTGTPIRAISVERGSYQLMQFKLFHFLNSTQLENLLILYACRWLLDVEICKVLSSEVKRSTESNDLISTHKNNFVVVCMESDEARRNLMISIAEEGMDTDDFVWLMIETRKLGFVAELADAMMLYAIALNRSTAAGLAKPTGTDLARFSAGQFEGFSGTVIINENCTRDPVFLVYGLNSSNQQTVMLKITERALNGDSTLIQDMQPPSVMWASRGGSPPRNRPSCDYDGSACPPTFVEKYLAITLVAVIVPVAILITAIIIILRYRKFEEERLNQLWKIPFVTLKRRNTKV
ncbi:unnamed protein product [Angiostrongylus costaricensis]|uniref:ANF_receptor domain-containing protein n=1 Tax=Angiostrongylus costaricensis TaxID=334426 RepID=A0A158PLE8_ANGCS|nr:unnamed protein product [Angiostrongylus costaricensis]